MDKDKDQWSFKLKSFIWSFLHRTFKFILHLLTGKCELQRICEKKIDKLEMITQVDQCIQNSNVLVEERKELETETDIDTSTLSRTICLKKGIKEEKIKTIILPFILESIYRANKIVLIASKLRSEKYSTSNQNHEKTLLELWKNLSSEPLINRISSQWKDIGFQGDDPSTDFRGMGILGLHNLNYFAQHHSLEAKKALLTSQGPSWYPLSITGISITKVILDMALQRKLHPLFYFSDGKIEQFHEIYSEAFKKFNDFWIKEKGIVTEFPYVFEKYMTMIESDLVNENLSKEKKKVE